MMQPKNAILPQTNALKNALLKMLRMFVENRQLIAEPMPRARQR